MFIEASFSRYPHKISFFSFSTVKTLQNFYLFCFLFSIHFIKKEAKNIHKINILRQEIAKKHLQARFNAFKNKDLQS